MAKVYVFLADGFEDVEALIPIDVLRRGGVDVVTVSIMDFPLVASAHGVNIEADIMFEQGDFSDADLLMLPGGMPGASNLFQHTGVCKAVMNQFAAGKKVAAICAAPAVVLAAIGVLSGKKATCYPGFEKGQKLAQHILATLLLLTATLPQPRVLLLHSHTHTNCSPSLLTSRPQTRLPRVCDSNT